MADTPPHVPSHPAIAPVMIQLRTMVDQVATGSLSALLRDLRSVIDQTLLLCTLDHASGGAPSSSPDLAGLYPGDRERDRILAALTECRGNQTLAAKMLGVSRRTLVYRIERYALPRPRKRVTR